MAKFVSKESIFDGSIFLPRLESSLYYEILSTGVSGEIMIKELELNLIKDVSISSSIVDQSNISYDNSLGVWVNTPPVDIPALVSGILSNSQYRVALSPPTPSLVITHNLGTLYPRVSVIDSSSNDLINTGVNYIDTSTLSIGLNLPIDNSVYVIVNGDPQNVSSQYFIGGGTDWEVQGMNIDGGETW